jgi:uncharacterized protein
MGAGGFLCFIPVADHAEAFLAEVACATGAVGRTALTNYLLQAAIIIPVCAGFNLFDRVTPSLGVLLALAVWSLQVPASVRWMRHFRFGPAEWVWRSLTYGRPQPMRMTGKSAAKAGA